MNNRLIIIPAFNEESTIGEIVTELINCGETVLVVDDCSNDNTVLVANKAGATVLKLSCQLGAWGATQAGIRKAYAEGYKKVITFDADGQHPVGAINIMFGRLDFKTDVVIGSCPQRGSFLRHIAWKFFKLLTKLEVSDLTSGLRAYSRRAMEVLTKEDASMLDYQDVLVLLLLRENKMNFAEVEVCMATRKDGKSRIFNSWLRVAEYMMLSTILVVCKIGK